jgi:lipopolysaccharide export system protein LptA
MTRTRLLLLPVALAVALFAALPAHAQTTDLFSGFSKKGNGPIEVDAQTLEIVEDGDERISTFSGGVTVGRARRQPRRRTRRGGRPARPERRRQDHRSST